MDFKQYDTQQRQYRRRSMRYALLSLLLIAIVLFSTGCAALLIGDNRKAYNIMVKAADYFKYPSSVQIASGEMFGVGLYCVIRAKNSYGNYRSDTYYVSSSGYPLDDYDSRCYSDKLNCGLINSALASHFGVSSSNVFSNMIGGNTMSSGTAAFIYIVIIIVALCLNGLLASNASDIANDKGYEKRKWFHMCFWLSPISYIIIAAMPDQNMRSKQDKTNELLEKMIASYNATAEKQAQNRRDDVSTYLPEL